MQQKPNTVKLKLKIMKKYTYNNSTNTIWTSFDFGDVEADNLEQAREKAIEKLQYDTRKCNDALNHCDNTQGFFVEMDYSQVEVELKGELFARKCDATGKGMNEGFCYLDGEKYFAEEKDFVAFLRSQMDDKGEGLSDEFILKESYDQEEHYWTQWEDEDDFQYQFCDGVLTEIQ
jgi:hypothetical protein